MTETSDGVDIDVANSHEPSYYEIALTNRQVVVAFVILLICLLCAFFSGVYIGREGTLRDQQQMVRTAPPAQPPANDEGRELDEFEFFDSANNRASAPDQRAELEPAAAPEKSPSNSSSDTTLLEDFGGEDVAPAPEEDAEEVTEAETPAERRIRERREREARRAAAAAEALSKPAAPAAEPAREEAPARPRRGAETAAAPASGSKGKVVIQVFSSAEKDQAERIRQRLANGGHPAFLSPVQVGGATMYRVLIGPYTTRGDAQKVADTVRKGYKLDTWITE